jgi:hypothetical protein
MPAEPPITLASIVRNTPVARVSAARGMVQTPIFSGQLAQVRYMRLDISLWEWTANTRAVESRQLTGPGAGAAGC